MRVAIVCPYAWDRPGGVQSHVRALAAALRARGHDVLTVAPRAGGATTSEDGLALIGRAVPVPANGSVAPVAFDPLAAAGVRRVLRAFRPEVVHLHEPLIPSLSLLALWTSDAPAVGTFHAAAGASFGYRVARPALRPAAARLAVRTAVSDAARALVASYFPGEYLLTPNGVDAARFAGAAPADLGGGKVVLFLSRIERRKGLEVLIQAFARLRPEGVRLVVAGAGPQERRCRRLASALGVDARFLGRVEEREVPSLYRAADVYCAPGLGGESFGIVLVEAMAAGCAVVCSDLPGFRAVAGGAGALVAPGDAAALADELGAVLSDDVRRAGMRRTSLRLAAMYDWGRLVPGVEAAYAAARARAGRGA